jgi:MurNAc alpha-1-phosphate uridylyltransferase
MAQVTVEREGVKPLHRLLKTCGVQAVVLAGGLATRMRPHTLTVPKSMLEVAGRPFVDWQLDRLAASGLRDIVLCIAHLGDQIRQHVGDGARFGLKIEWSDDSSAMSGSKLLGTAGALRAALHLLAPTFLVTYGDSYLPFDYAAPLRVLDAHADCDGVMAIFKNDGQWDQSNVVTDGAWVIRYEKGGSSGIADPALHHIDYGATALRRDVIASLPEPQPQGLEPLMSGLAAQGRLRAYVAHDRFYEIGSPEGLAELDLYLRMRASS